jgi:RND superfamily putative drug exporter
VYIAKDGTVSDPADKAAIEQSVSRLEQLPHVSAVVGPFTAGAVSADGSTAYATVAFTVVADRLSAAEQRALFAAGRSAESTSRGHALTVEFGGDAAQEQVQQGGTEGLGVAVAAVVLAITFGSLLLAGLPLLTGIVGVGLGVLGIEIASGFFHLSTTTLTLALMLGLAVAIDYALFIVSRFRQELKSGLDGEEAAGRAVGTAGSAVVFAGATVVVALAALSVVGIPFLTAMGLGAAGTVLGAILIALTLLPALLGFVGQRVLRKSQRRAAPADVPVEGSRRPKLGERWARGVVRRPLVVVGALVAGLVVIAIPALDLQLAMPSDANAAGGTTQRRAYDALAEAFGPGFNGPLVVVADLAGSPDPTAAASTIQHDLTTVSGVATVSPAAFDRTKQTAVYTLVPRTGPLDPATESLVTAVRAEARGWEADTRTSVYVTGATAVGIDISDKLRSALIPYLAIVVGLAFVLLTIVFRSLLVPLKATLGFLLSIAATFGAVVAVFQWGWLKGLIGLDTTGPVISFLPIFLVGILFGLAMDYEVFLVTRMREEHVYGAPPTDAVVNGFAHSARVVSAAAVIMFSVFAGFVLGHDPIVKSMGFALAAGVAIDAFLVRMTLVPAVMSLLGDVAWKLPGWLDRVVPRVDVEGADLTSELESSERELTTVSRA